MDQIMQDTMKFTPAGASKANELLAQQNKQDAAIRVFVKSGGCSGYSYGMAIDEKTLEGDRFFEDQGVKLVVDQASWPLLKGSEIDYVENMMGGGFNVVNPNATSSCGCGHSFRTDGQAAPDGEGSSSCH
ncbi:MAG: iron-sulfur cluster insertion protein ErpA [Trueperaceae bacterium]|nr:iron-sulfur cluster insertion protein ErpA [Trueperaceae bacterium]